MKKSTRRLLPTYCLGTLLLWSSHAVAQGAAAAAEALFSEGRQLSSAGKLAEACEKFAESQRLDASAGTALNLGQCHEKLGRTASAWAEYLVAKRLARAAGRAAIAEEAEGKAAVLKEQLSYIQLELETTPEGLEVFIGSTQLAQAAWGTKLPLDPGTHQLKIQAPGYEPVETTISVGSSGSVTRVHLPQLSLKSAQGPLPQAAPSDANGGQTAPATRPDPSKDNTLAYVVGGVSLAAVGGGILLGVLALNANEEALDLCGGRTTNCPEGTEDKSDKAKSLQVGGWITGGVGVVGLGVAALLFLTGETDGESATNGPVHRTGSLELGWRPSVGLRHAGLLMEGSF